MSHSYNNRSGNAPTRWISLTLICSLILPAVLCIRAAAANNQPPALKGMLPAYSEAMLIKAWTQVHERPVLYKANKTAYNLCIATNGIYSPQSGFFINWHLVNAWYVPYRPMFDPGQFKLGSIAYLFKIKREIKGNNEVGGINSETKSPIILEYNIIRSYFFQNNIADRFKKLKKDVYREYNIKNSNRKIIESSIVIGNMRIRTYSDKNVTSIPLKSKGVGLLSSKTMNEYIDGKLTPQSFDYLSAALSNTGCYHR